MEVWQETLKVALIGTERQAPIFTESAEPISRMLAELNVEERERTLLRASGVLTTYRRAGYRPRQTEEPLPMPAEAEAKPLVPAAAMQDLLVMLGGEYREALSEWLQAATERGWRVPEEHLVELLDFGRGHPENRTALLPLLGKRGRWLAAQNPDWRYALQFSLFEIENTPETETGGSEDVDMLWQTGAKEERVALLHRLRRSDPAQARTLVESTWKQEAPAERAEFIATFRAALSMEDEPFLENALDDKRKEVRVTAQELLARLPESRYCLRMWERVRPLVRMQKVEGGSGRSQAAGGLVNRVRSLLTLQAPPSETIAVELPQECDRAMIRDGIEVKPPSSAIGEKTWWLTQMLARVPLVLWSRESGETSAAIVAANRSEEWKQALLEGWTSALRHRAETDWAVALFSSWSEMADKMPLDPVWKEVLPPEVFEAGLLHLLQVSSPRIEYNHPAFTLLVQHKTEWSAPLTQAMLEKLNSCKGSPYYIAGIVGAFAPFIPAGFQAEFSAIWSKLAEKNMHAQGQINRYVALNTFRTEMRRKIDAAALQEN
ncbi:MAG: hypothetical protein JWL77_838 [Chthonomonadaceae bacterium]|nr:hypothetical protein [Chthonomonadaceae bacterium]